MYVHIKHVNACRAYPGINAKVHPETPGEPQSFQKSKQKLGIGKSSSDSNWKNKHIFGFRWALQ